MEEIVIIGSSGFAKEVQFLLDEINNNPARVVRYDDLFKVLGFINNESNTWGTKINGLPILGDEDWIIDYNEKNKTKLSCAMGIGRPDIKRRIVNKLGDNVKWPNLIHPSVVLSRFVEMGVGNIITAGNILTTNIVLRNHIMLNLAGTVGHDTMINDYTVVSPGVNISGNVNIDEGAYLGTGCKILEKVNIGKWTTIGGAALVNKNVEDNETVVGVPAKAIKLKKAGWHK